MNQPISAAMKSIAVFKSCRAWRSPSNHRGTRHCIPMPAWKLHASLRFRGWEARATGPEGSGLPILKKTPRSHTLTPRLLILIGLASQPSWISKRAVIFGEAAIPNVIMQICEFANDHLVMIHVDSCYFAEYNSRVFALFNRVVRVHSVCFNFVFRISSGSKSMLVYVPMGEGGQISLTNELVTKVDALKVPSRNDS